MPETPEEAPETMRARHARDRMRDVLELLGASAVAVEMEETDATGRTVVRIGEMDTDLATLLADVMVKGIVPWPMPGIAVWDPIERRLGEVVSAIGPRVRLRTLSGSGMEWFSTPDRLRVARISEIDEARARGRGLASEVGNDGMQAPGTR